MLVLEWNIDDALQVRFNEGYEDGRNEERESVAVKLICMGLKFADIQEVNHAN